MTEVPTRRPTRIPVGRRVGTSVTPVLRTRARTASAITPGSSPSVPTVAMANRSWPAAPLHQP